jgi:2-C-methyl-D-erythritol 4-phosphate cytidylyltransferase
MITALIFAGGVGERMNSKAKPKQFLKIYGKPILIHTIENFEYHVAIDEIVVVCLENWIKEFKNMLDIHKITKVRKIVSGGSTGHDSIYNGLKAIRETANDDTIVVIHDGIRPLITEELITENIEAVKKYGSAITVSEATESPGEVHGDKIIRVPSKKDIKTIRAPQTFYLKDIWKAHQRAVSNNYKSIDSAELMSKYGDIELHAIVGPSYNIKLTSPSDYYIFRAIYEAKENLQIFGL